MKAVLLGMFLGAVVVFDPLVTAYLLRDYGSLIPLRDFPYLLSLTTALTAGFIFLLGAFMPRLPAMVIQDYPQYFAYSFLLAFQFTGLRSGPLDPTLVVICVFGALFLAALFIRGEEQRFVSTPLTMLYLALAACVIVSLTVEFRLLSFLKSLKPFVVFLLLINFLPRHDFLLKFLRWLLVLAILSATFGIVQEVAWLGFQYILAVLPRESLSRSFETYYGYPIFRVPGMMVSYTTLALYLATALMLSLSALLWPSEKPLLPRRWLWACVLLCATTVGLTIAKPILLGAAVGIGLLLILHRPMRVVPATLAALVGALVLTIAIAVVPGNIDTALQLADEIPKTEQERIRLDRESIEGILHSPYTWLGRGIGAGARYTAHTLRWPAHNAFILVAAELGVVGLVVYLLIYGWVIVRAVALNIVVKSGPYLPVVRGLLAILVVQLVAAQFEASFLDVFVWTIFATIEAVWFQVRREALRSGNPLRVADQVKA